MFQMLEDLKTKKNVYMVEIEQTKIKFNQLCGALHVVDEMIAELEKQEAEKPAEGEKQDGDVEHQEPEQAPQE
jgi:hypothetical protein